MSQKSFGKWLRATRSSVKMSQEQLAKSLNFSRSDLAKIEEGQLAFPLTKINALSLVLKVEKKFVLEMRIVFHESHPQSSKKAS